MIRREDRGKIRLLLLDRPPSNGLTLSLLDQLGREIDSAGSNPGVRCLVIGSAIPKYFSSGLDLDEMLSLPENDRPALFERMVETHRKIASIPQPTVAAIQGYARLGGFILTLGCDWRFLSAETGRVSLSEVRLGLSPTTPLIRLVSLLTGRPGLVKELILQGKTLRGQEALEAGLTDRLISNEGFLEEVLQEAERLAKMAPVAYASIKRAFRRSVLIKEEELWQEGLREFQKLLSGPEAKEGLQAMKEKRKPRWE